MAIPKSVIKQARQVDLIEFLEHKGYDLIPEDHQGNFRLPGDSGLIIKENYYKHFGNDKGGNAVDFCMDILKMDFTNAVSELVKFDNENIKEKKAKRKNQNRQLVMPVASPNNKRAIDYLHKTRKIPLKLIHKAIGRGLLYQDTKGNCIFVCMDKEGLVKGGIVRGTKQIPFKGRVRGSDTNNGWIWKSKKKAGMVVVESPVDLLSLLALYPKTVTLHKHIEAMSS